MSDADKDKWKVVLTPKLTSSDESGMDEDGKEVIQTHALPWLTSSVQDFKRRLDDAILKDKSPQAKRQMKERVEGLLSLRPYPGNDEYPSWVINSGI